VAYIRRWEVNSKVDLREMGLEGVDWIGLIWLRIRTGAGCSEHCHKPSASVKGEEFLD
jgi:hypothetical protein